MCGERERGGGGGQIIEKGIFVAVDMQKEEEIDVVLLLALVQSIGGVCAFRLRGEEWTFVTCVGGRRGPFAKMSTTHTTSSWHFGSREREKLTDE